MVQINELITCTGMSPPSSAGLEDSNDQRDSQSSEAIEGSKPSATAAAAAPDFSRPPPGFPNMAMPPPFVPPAIPPPILVPPPMMVPDPYGTDSFLAGSGGSVDDYYQYEPTQDSQWGTAEWRAPIGAPIGPPPISVAGVAGLGGLSSKGRRNSHGTPPVAVEESR